MHLSSIPKALADILEVFEGLGVEYRIGGSVASSTLGHFRATNDLDCGRPAPLGQGTGAFRAARASPGPAGLSTHSYQIHTESIHLAAYTKQSRATTRPSFLDCFVGLWSLRNDGRDFNHAPTERFAVDTALGIYLKLIPLIKPQSFL